MAENIDLCPTFTELAGGASGPTEPDGHSLVPLLHGETVADWRTAALIEHFKPPRVDANDPDAPDQHSANPPSYEALRLEHALYVEYDTLETSYYDLERDPYELKNVASSLSPADRQRLQKALAAAKACTGTRACWDAQHVK